MEEVRDLKEVVSQWCVRFDKGTDFDLWGQPLEAIDSYSR